MAVNRVDYDDLMLSFVPVDADGKRGITQQQLTKLCVSLTKQAYSLLHKTYSATTEDSIIDSESCFAIIQAAASRIAESWFQFIYNRMGGRPPVFMFNPWEQAAILNLEEFQIDFIDNEARGSGI